MDADETLVAREIERRRASGTRPDTAMANLLADVPTAVAAKFLRDQMLRALGGAQQGEYWLRVQELNFLAHRKRRADARRAGYVMSTGFREWSVMGSIPDE